MQTHSEEPATATVVLIGEDSVEMSKSAQGEGPIAAAFQALEQATGVEMLLSKFELRSASIGEDAQGEVTVTVEIDGQSFRGRGTSVDIVEAGCRACLEVINRTLRRRQRGESKGDTVRAARANI